MPHWTASARKASNGTRGTRRDWRKPPTPWPHHNALMDTTPADDSIRGVEQTIQAIHHGLRQAAPIARHVVHQRAHATDRRSRRAADARRTNAAHRIGNGLVPTAYAPDGVIEGLELPDRDFVVGVQWHAEAMVDRPEQLALFESFVAASGRYDAPPARVRRAA